MDDDGNVLVKLENGAKGVLYASQISVGEENNLRIRIYGEKGGLEWLQPESNTLLVKWPDRPIEIYRSGHPYIGDRGQAHTRLPAGHPEGFLEAFANLYRNFSMAVRAKIEGTLHDRVTFQFPLFFLHCCQS